MIQECPLYRGCVEEVLQQSLSGNFADFSDFEIKLVRYFYLIWLFILHFQPNHNMIEYFQSSVIRAVWHQKLL